MSGIGPRVAASKALRPTSFYNSRWATRRCVHHAIGVLYPIENGLGKFLPPAALKTVAVDYQNGLLDRLNGEVRGTADANKSVVQTVVNTAGIKERTLAFNYATLSLNNSFFLAQLKPPPPPPAQTHQSEIGPDLANRIRDGYGSLEGLKSSFSAAVDGLSTNGWVWLVADKAGNLGIIPTFGPGTLLVRSRSYMGTGAGDILGEYDYKANSQRLAEEALKTQQEIDIRTSEVHAQAPIPKNPPPGVAPSSPVSGISGHSTPTPSNPLDPRFYHSSATRRMVFGLETPALGVWGKEDRNVHNFKPKSTADLLNPEVLYPLFCVSVYEHAWMSAGYGVWGKSAWMKEFWTVVNWHKVNESYMESCLSGRNTRSS